MKNFGLCLISVIIINFMFVNTLPASETDSFSGIYHMKDDPKIKLEILKIGIDEYKVIPNDKESYSIGFLDGKYYKGAYRYLQKYNNVCGFTQIELIGNGVIKHVTQLSLHPKETKSEFLYVKEWK